MDQLVCRSRHKEFDPLRGPQEHLGEDNPVQHGSQDYTVSVRFMPPTTEDSRQLWVFVDILTWLVATTRVVCNWQGLAFCAKGRSKADACVHR